MLLWLVVSAMEFCHGEPVRASVESGLRRVYELRALVPLMTAPHRWEKTEHGGARTSLRACRSHGDPIAAAMPRRPPPRGAGVSP